MDIWQILMTPFSLLMKGLYFLLFENYGLAIFVFAFVVKVILFPFSLKGKKGMIQMNALQGKVTAIQKKYPNDKEKQNLEIQRLYEKEKVNPMGGCLWSFLPILILFPLYAVVRRPLKYLMGVGDASIGAVTEAVKGAGITVTGNYPELSMAAAFHRVPAALEAAKNAMGEAGSKLFGLDFNFFGIDLSATPTPKFWQNGLSWGSIGLFLIPVLCAGTAFLSTHIMNKTNQMNQQQPQEGSAANTTKMMTWMSPLMMLCFSFIMPAGMGIYIIANSVFTVLQELLAGKILKKDYEAAAALRAEEERKSKEEDREKRRQAAERKAQAIAEGKAKKGKKGQQEKLQRDTSVIGVSGVGTRAYARGRAYDPYRYSPEGPTPYKDPKDIVDEAAVEAALAKKKGRKGAKAEEEAPELEAPAPESVDTAVEEVSAEEAPVEEAPVEEAPADADPWEEIDREVAEIQDAADAQGEEEPKE